MGEGDRPSGGRHGVSATPSVPVKGKTGCWTRAWPLYDELLMAAPNSPLTPGPDSVKAASVLVKAAPVLVKALPLR